MNDQSQRMQINETARNEKTNERDTFSEVEHRHDNPVASLDSACANKSIIYVTMHERKTPIKHVIPQQNLPKHKKLRVSRI